MEIAQALRNGLLNLGMQVFPVLAALVAVPFTIKAFGPEAFSVFSLGVTGIVLFNYLNFGVAQAATRSLAKLSPDTDGSEVNRIFFSGAVTILAIGLIFSLLAHVFAPQLAEAVSKDLAMRPTAQRFFHAIGLASPLFLFIIYLRGCLESQQLFKYSATNRAVLNSLIFLSPALPAVMGLGIETSLYVILTAHAASMLFLCVKTTRALSLKPRLLVSRREVGDMLTAGAWMTVSSLAAMLLLYADRFIISMLSGLTIVAYYIASFDLVSRLSLIYGSLTAAFFPAIAQWRDRGEHRKITGILSFSTKAMFFVMIIVVTVIATLSREILSLWISAEYAEHAALMLSVLSFGIFFNAMAVTPQRALMAIGQERLVGTYVALQSLLYVLLSFAAVSRFGPMGACVVFVIRGLLEFVALSVMLNAEYFRFGPVLLLRKVLPFALVLVGSMSLSFALLDAPVLRKLIVLGVLLLVFPLFYYGRMLAQEDRLALKNKVMARMS
jgi:Membrane protein involved in the export of O-antigen and teichoic acid